MAARKAEVIITCDGAAAKQVLEGINRELQKAIKEREQLLQKQKQNGTLTQDEIKRDRELKKYIDSLTTAQQKSAQEMKKYSDVMKDLAGSKTKDLKKALGEVKRALDNMSAKDPKRQQLVNDLKKIQNQIEANTGAIKKQQGAWGALGTTMKNLFAYAGIFAAFNRLKSLMSDVVKKNFELSDQLANIRKVSGLAMKDINQLTKNLAKIDTRSSIQELNDLAYTGSKLGFGNYGIEGLESFVKSAVKVQNALKEDMGQDAMTALSKMVEVMGLIPKMGVEKAMDATGSAIFKLASTSTATGSNIVEFSKRLMGLANQAGITTAELLAFGSAADSMALMPEVAATAFNKLITAMQKQPNLIENALNIKPGTINDLYKVGRMADAMVLVFEKMREKGGMNALMHAGVFKDLGSDGARLVGVMATMANRVDILNRHMETSRDAFEEATAVEQEYNIQMETAEAYMERAANIWTKAFVNPEGVDTVKEFSKAWYDMTKTITESKSLRVVFELFIGTLKLLITLIPAITFAAITRGLIGLGSAFGAATIAANGFRAAWSGLSTAMKANWISLGIGLLAQAAVYIYTLKTAVDETDEAVKNFTSDLSELNGKYEAAEDELRRYKSAIDNAAVGTKEHSVAIKNFNDKFGGYLKNLLTEKSTALDVASAYKEVCKQLRNKMALQLREEDLNKTVKPLAQTRADIGETYENEIKDTKYSQFDRNWLRAKVADDERKDLFTTAGGQHATARDLIASMGLNLSNDVVNDIIEQVKKDNKFYETGTFKTTSLTSGFQWQRPEQYDERKILFNALKYIQQEERVRNQTERVYNKYDDVIDKTIPQDNSEPTNFNDLQNAPDKGAAAAAKKAAQEAKAALRKDMQDMQKDTEGVITKIEEWYRLQEAAINEARADGQITEDRAKEMVRALNIMKNESLATARRAVTTGQTEAWDEMKRSTLPKMMADSSDLSQNLLNEIQEVDVKNLHDKLKQFNGDKSVYGLSIGAFFDQMNAKAAGNQRESARLRAAITNEVEKALKQYHFVELAQDKMRSDLEAMGFITETYEQWAERMRQGITEKPDTKLPSGKTISDKAAYEQMGQKFVEKRDIAYRINIENEKEALEWIQQFATDAEGNLEDWVYAFPELLRWIDLIKTRDEALKQDALPIARQAQQNIDEAMPSIQKFYSNLMQYEGSYYDAIKKRDDLQNKRINSWWEQSSEKKQIDEMKWDNQINQFQYGMGNGKGFLFDTGFTNDLANDPEIEQQRLLLEEKMRIFEETKKLREQDEVSEEVYQQRMQEMQQQTINYAQAIYSNVQSRVDRMQKFLSPISNFAQQAGQKIGEMVAGVKDQSMTWNEIWKNMVLAMAESVIQMGAQYLQNLIMQKSINKAMEAEELAHTVVIVNAGIAAASAKTLSTLGWLGLAIIPVISALLMGLLSAALGSRKESNSNSSSANKVKLKSGMLTYDEGNVQTVVGDDGRVYRAREQRSLPSGVSMITEPIATTVNGQQALVGERGPEIVIGRKTTRAIQMNRPDLLRDLVRFDKGITTRKARTFDEGNLQDLASAIRPEDGSTTVTAGTDASAERQALLDRMDKSDALMAQVLYFLQNPVAPNINMYGRGGLHEKMQQANQFYKRYEDKR